MHARSLACLLALVAPLTLSVACKGGGDSTPRFITILRTSPVDGATEVSVATRVGFQVSDGARIDPATLNGSTFFLTDEDGNTVTGTYSVGGDDDDPDVAVMEFEVDALDVITRYTATITTELVAGGASLEEDFEWSFTTIDSEWGISDWLEATGTGVSNRPQIAIDSNLRAIAVWEYRIGNETTIWASHYTRADLWGDVVVDPIPIETEPGASNPRVAVDGAGNGFAVWQRNDPGSSQANVWVARYDVETDSWSDPESLRGPNGRSARAISIAADADGNAFAVWVEQDVNTRREIATANRYVAGSGWGATERLEEVSTSLAGNRTAVGVDGSGNAVALWSRPSVSGDAMWTNRYVVGSGWGSRELINGDPDTGTRAERLAVSLNGDAFVVWVHEGAGRDDIYAARLSNGLWDPAERIDTHDGNHTVQPDVAVDGAGFARAVWSQIEPYPDPELLDDDIANIYAIEYAPGAGWGTPELIEPPRQDDMGNLDPDEDGDATVPRIAMNSAGNTFVVWRQIWDNWGSIWSNRLDAGEPWVGAELIENQPRTANNPIIAVDENRHAHAVWVHGVSTGVDWVRTNRFE